MRLSLRAFFVMLSLLCLALAWLGLEVRRGQEREKAFVQLSELGVLLCYEHQITDLHFDGETFGWFTGERPLPSIVYDLFGEHFMLRAKFVRIYDPEFKEEMWECLSHFPEVRGLEFSVGNYDQLQLSHLRSFQKLEEVSLQYTDIELTDTEVKLFSELPNLKVLTPSLIKPDQVMRDKLEAALPHCVIQGRNGKFMWLPEGYRGWVMQNPKVPVGK
ncbi:MAG: hypothetical protein COA78_19865 [Blastopirellula sp.]|nr:MAG: hypothetical protein COA78_19865 [Blastopirellula sp.]